MSSLFSAFTSSSSRQQPSPSTDPPSTTTTSSQPPNNPTQRTTEARAAFDATLAATGASLDADLASRAKNIHDNAARLAEQDRRVQREIAGLKAEGDALERLYGKTERGLGGESVEGFEREIEAIERELGVLDGVLDDVEGAGGEEGGGDGDGDGDGERGGGRPAEVGDTSTGQGGETRELGNRK